MKKAILAIAETSEKGFHQVSTEVAAFARILAEYSGLPVMACLIGGDDIDSRVDRLEKAVGCDTTGISVPGLGGYDRETAIAAISDLLTDYDFDYICIPHTARGADFAPVLAAGIGAACITAVEKAEKGDQGITFTRRVLNGKKVARVSACRLPAVLTIQPGIFKPDSAPAPARGTRRITKLEFTPRSIVPIGIKPARTDAGSLQAADVVVAAGNGIGNLENLELVKQLAGQFPRSAVAGSRPVCDRKWLPYGCQVGVTGAVVRPRLYIACGISGASQHVGGIRESGFIVAINRDPNAAFFNFADLCIVEDLASFIPLLLERISESA